MRRPTERVRGFTIIEVLVSVALFAIVVLIVLAPLTGLFGLTQKSNRQVTATNLAQQAVETIKGQWQSANGYRYNINCVAGPMYTTTITPTPNVAAVTQDEDVQGNDKTNTTTFAVGDATSCPPSSSGASVPSGPPLREVTVTATVNGVTSTLVVEVAHP